MTQYSYRKRRAAETRQIDQDDDLTTRTDHAIQIKDKMKKLLKMTKDELQTELQQKKDTLDQMRQQLPTRTIEDLRLSLLAVSVFERL